MFSEALDSLVRGSLVFQKRYLTGSGNGQTGMQGTATIDARSILLLRRGGTDLLYFFPSDTAIFGGWDSDQTGIG